MYLFTYVLLYPSVGPLVIEFDEVRYYGTMEMYGAIIMSAPGRETRYKKYTSVNAISKAREDRQPTNCS